MNKKIIGIFLVVLMLCQPIFLPQAYAETSEIDVQEINLLKALELLKGDQNGDLRLSDTLVRSEYTALILRMMGYEDIFTNYNGISSFNDVPQDHWAKGYIEFAKGINLIDGVGNNLFAPDRPVSRSEAIKIIVSALGYGEIGEFKGGYPYGYEKQATDLGLLKNASSKKEFTRGDACRLICNALEIDIMDGLGNVVSGGNVLKEFLDIEIFKGSVTGTPGINFKTKVGNGFIEIDGVKYKNTYLTDKELFGNEVIFYLKGEHPDESVIYIEEIEDANRLEITSDNVLAADNLQTFSYINEREKVKEVELDENILLFYNGERVSAGDINDALLKPDQGNVILLDNDGDKKFELAIVNNYRSIKIGSVNEDRISDVYQKHINLQKAEDIVITQNNTYVNIDELKTGDVISVAESLSGERIRILADTSVLTGYISQVKNDNGGNVYVVKDGENLSEIQTAKSFEEAMEAGLAENWLKPDSRVLNFYLDAFGKIADIKLFDEENISDTLQYGYLIEVVQEGELGGNVAIKMLTANNKFEVFKVGNNKKVKLGRPFPLGYSQSSVYPNELTEALGGSGTASRQIVQYRIDDENNLKEIFLADNVVNPNVISMDMDEAFYTYRQGVLDQKYFMDNSTIVFDIPENAVYEDVMSAGGYKNFFSEGWGKNCTLYDVENGHVGAIVIHDNVNITYNSIERGYETILSYGSSPVFFIDKTMQSMDKDGNIFTTMDGWQNGKKTQVNISNDLAKDTESMSQLRPGSVIQYEMNTNEKSWAATSDVTEQMVVFKQIYDFEVDNGSAIRWDHDVIIKDLPGIFTLWGTIDIVELGYFSVLVDEGGKTESYALQIMNNAIFMKYDSTKNSFEVVSRFDLIEGKKVYVAKQSSNQIIVIY